MSNIREERRIERRLVEALESADFDLVNIGGVPVLVAIALDCSTPEKCALHYGGKRGDSIKAALECLNCDLRIRNPNADIRSLDLSDLARSLCD